MAPVRPAQWGCRTLPECSHCGSAVSTDYIRVFAVDGEVDVCPRCPDRVRDMAAPGGFREAKASREATTRTRYDPAFAADGGDADA